MFILPVDNPFKKNQSTKIHKMITTKLFFSKSILLFLLLPALFIACKSKHKKTLPASDTVKTVTQKPEPAAPSKTAPVTKAPIINITDTIAVKKLVLYVKDSAATSERIAQKLAQLYGFKIPEIIKKNKLKITGAPIAWYKSQKAPFFFEAGLPVDKKPAKLPKNFFVKNIGGDSAVVAHFYGPYNITSMGYEALNDWLKSKKKKKLGEPYEVYVGDPFDKNGKPLDPYRVQTDIIQPYK